ncbi:hypothetical protein TMM008_48730 [Pseudomonas sp. 008]|jgi:hypothetical protein|nr:hypothetical protein TMM008_48730 [Pseudomonas sp. 008]
MTVRATNVHKYLRGGYIGALFRRVFTVTPGDKPGNPRRRLILARSPSRINGRFLGNCGARVGR